MRIHSNGVLPYDDNDLKSADNDPVSYIKILARFNNPLLIP